MSFFGCVARADASFTGASCEAAPRAPPTACRHRWGTQSRPEEERFGSWPGPSVRNARISRTHFPNHGSTAPSGPQAAWRPRRSIQKSQLPRISPRHCPIIDRFLAPFAMDERLVSHQPGLLDSPGRRRTLNHGGDLPCQPAARTLVGIRLDAAPPAPTARRRHARHRRHEPRGGGGRIALLAAEKAVRLAYVSGSATAPSRVRMTLGLLEKSRRNRARSFTRGSRGAGGRDELGVPVVLPPGRRVAEGGQAETGEDA